MTAYNDDVHFESVAATHDNYTSRKNDPAVRRLLQTLAAANVPEPEFSAIREILECGVQKKSRFDRFMDDFKEHVKWLCS